MHRTLRLTAVAALVALPFSLGAQDMAPRPVSFGISAGLSMPMGNLSDAFNSGFNVTGHIGYKPAMFTNLSFRGDVGFDRFNAKEDISGTAVTQEGTFTAIGVTANAIYAFPQSDAAAILRPYLLGGLGFYNTKSKVTTTLGTVEASSENSDSNFGLQAGIGAEFALSGFSTFAEAKFVNVLGDGSSIRWIPISFGIRF
jgi:hypothetical protein